MIEKKLKIEGMSCGHCIAAVERLISEVNGIESSVASLPDNVTIVFDEKKSSIEDFKKIINESGIYKTS